MLYIVLEPLMLYTSTPYTKWGCKAWCYFSIILKMVLYYQCHTGTSQARSCTVSDGSLPLGWSGIGLGYLPRPHCRSLIRSTMPSAFCVWPKKGKKTRELRALAFASHFFLGGRLCGQNTVDKSRTWGHREIAPDFPTLPIWFMPYIFIQQRLEHSHSAPRHSPSRLSGCIEWWCTGVNFRWFQPADSPFSKTVSVLRGELWTLSFTVR